MSRSCSSTRNWPGEFVKRTSSACGNNSSQMYFSRRPMLNLRRRREPRQIERVLVEHHDGRIALLGPAALDIAVAHHQEGALLALHDLAVFRHDGRALVAACANRR